MAEENKVQHSYDESDIQVLEGLRSRKKKTRYVYRNNIISWVTSPWYGKS